MADLRKDLTCLGGVQLQWHGFIFGTNPDTWDLPCSTFGSTVHTLAVREIEVMVLQATLGIKMFGDVKNVISPFPPCGHVSWPPPMVYWSHKFVADPYGMHAPFKIGKCPVKPVRSVRMLHCLPKASMVIAHKK